MALSKELLTLLEDLEDSAEMQDIRNSDEETVDWQQAKTELRAN